MNVIHLLRVIALLSLLSCSLASGQDTTERLHAMGVCELVELQGSGQADLFPALTANRYFHLEGEPYPKKYVPEFGEFRTALVSILQQPKHGTVVPTNADGDWTISRYRPNDGYQGDDSFVVLVTKPPYKVELHYFVRSTSGTGESATDNKACVDTEWKISIYSSDKALVHLAQTNAVKHMSE